MLEVKLTLEVTENSEGYCETSVVYHNMPKEYFRALEQALLKAFSELVDEQREIRGKR